VEEVEGGHVVKKRTREERDLATPEAGTVKRAPVDFDYDCINPTFLHWMAKIGPYAAAKYGSWHQYLGARLVGGKSPVNHISGHLKAYKLGEPYDHFDGDLRWHLVAIAYNCMMEFFYHSKWGHIPHPTKVDEEKKA
jgi:hypothetical protein